MNANNMRSGCLGPQIYHIFFVSFAERMVANTFSSTPFWSRRFVSRRARNTAEREKGFLTLPRGMEPWERLIALRDGRVHGSLCKTIASFFLLAFNGSHLAEDIA